MPVTKAVVLAKAVPLVAAAYHFIAVPVATKFATVEAVQNVCEAVAVGAAESGLTVIVIVAVLAHNPAVGVKV